MAQGEMARFGKVFLRFSEKMAVRFSHVVISDNDAIAEYVMQAYGLDSHVIAYGGDHAMAVEAIAMDEYDLPQRYAFSVCRIEPENNVHVILEAFSKLDDYPLVMVGNWNYSEYGQRLRDRYADFKHIFLLGPVYDPGKLKMLRSRAFIYVHGHSAGGTNPSLVEAMHFGTMILAFDCKYNRSTTENKALFFNDGAELRGLVESIGLSAPEKIGQDMFDIAQRRYTWNIVARQYFVLMGA